MGRPRAARLGRGRLGRRPAPGADFAVEARARGLDWARDVSEPARQKFPADYQRRYDGRMVQLGPHVRRTGRQLLRIYCYLDAARRVVVVGHVGGHLGDSTVLTARADELARPPGARIPASVYFGPTRRDD